MENLFGIILYIIAFISAWGFLFLLLKRKTFNPIFALMALHIYLLLLPAFFHIAGVHTSIIDRFSFSIGNAYALEGLILGVFYLFLGVGCKLFSSSKVVASIFPDFSKPRSDVLTLIGIGMILVITLIMLMMPFSKSGMDLANTVELIRYEGYFAGLWVLLQIPLVGMFIVGAYLLDLMNRKRQKKKYPQGAILYASIIFILLIFLSILFGGKGNVIFPLAAFAITYFLHVRKKSLMSMVLPIVALMVLIVGFQAARTSLVMNAKADQKEFVYGALGFDMMDGNLFYISSIGKLHHTAMGEDFYLGFINIMPRFVWGEKPKFIDPGGRFRYQVEQKEGLGAWPVMHFNVWYGNFGWLGVCLGGFLSGVFLAGMTKRYEDFQDNPYSSMFLLMLVFKMTTFGIGQDFVAEYVLWMLPLFMFKWFTSRNLLKMSSSQTSMIMPLSGR